MPPLLAVVLLAFGVAVFFADLAFLLFDPSWRTIANALLFAVLALALTVAAAGTSTRRGGGGWEVSAALCIAFLACLELLARLLQQDTVMLLVAVTLNACMVAVASMLATTAVVGASGPGAR